VPDGECANDAHRPLCQVERQLCQWLSLGQEQHHCATGEPAGQQRRVRREKKSDRQRHIGEREGMRVPADVDVDDDRVGDGEAGGECKPRNTTEQRNVVHRRDGDRVDARREAGQGQDEQPDTQPRAETPRRLGSG
jgi:hypothetical protein